MERVGVLKFSFCTTCGNRLCDLRHTLPRNLALVEEGEEIVLLDYNSRDGLREWVNQNFADALGAGRLRFYSETTAPRYFSCHAKNVSHLLGRGQVVVNLDADNFLTPAYLANIRSHDFAAVEVVFANNGSGGHKGRVAFRADAFKGMGGYDEQLDKGYGDDEVDLLRRINAARRYRMRGLFVDPGAVIPTPDTLRAQGNPPGVSLRQSNDLHRRMTKVNLKARKLVANAGKPWGQAVLRDHLGAVHLISSLGNS